MQLDDSVDEDELILHDEKADLPYLALMLSRFKYPDFPEPIGVFRDIDRPIYEEKVTEQIEAARTKAGAGDLEKLFNSGDTWTVE